jgi:hypothetical protein
LELVDGLDAFGFEDRRYRVKDCGEADAGEDGFLGDAFVAEYLFMR